jgi:hypothetical protein
MNSHQFRRSSSELTSDPLICRFRKKRDRKGIAHIYYERLLGGMGLAPHLVCKTSVTVKDWLEKAACRTHEVPWWVRFLLSLSKCVQRFFSATTVIPQCWKCGNTVIVALPRKCQQGGLNDVE